MTIAFQRYATPFITGLFLVSLISGFALFVHIGTGSFRGMHEWLSMVLILPFGLHLWKNWKPMTIYFRKPAFIVAMLVSLAAALGFVFTSGSGGDAGGPPQFAFTKAIFANPAAKVAPLLNMTADELVSKLKAAGFSAASPDLSISEIAAKSGKNEFEMAAMLKPAKP